MTDNAAGVYGVSDVFPFITLPIMFEQLQAAPPDKILALIAAYRDDPRPHKIDLGVGVYRDNEGRTPVLGAVREAERRLLASQASKAYVGMAGDEGFNAAIMRLALGDQVEERHAAVQAPGGCGALRLLAELIQRARPGANIWLSDPTWPNHGPLLGSAGLKLQSYPYFNAASKTVDFAAMMAKFNTLPAGDVVLLHGCCHNPTGAGLTLPQWQEVAQLLLKQQLFPFIDLAYQGFGDGLEADAAGVRAVMRVVPEAVLAVSCSKNFGVYRDRVGCSIVQATDAKQAQAAKSQLCNIGRGIYSMPPDHGAAVVGLVLNDPQLRTDWESELEGMRARMLGLRQRLSGSLRALTGDGRFDYIAGHRGMFSLLGANAEQLQALRERHAVFAVEGGRINIAGLRESQIEPCAKAFADVLG